MHTTCFRWHGSSTMIICLSFCKRDIDVVLGQTWQNSVCYADDAMLDVFSRLTRYQVLVEFPLPVRKCSFQSLSELLNSIRMTWKLPLFTDAVLVLTSRWLLREMFYFPHNIMALMITLATFVFLSNISWFWVEIPKWRGFLRFLGTLNWRNAGVECPLMTLHFVMMLKCSIFTRGFFQFLEWCCYKCFFSVLEDPMGLSCITQYLQKTSHLRRALYKPLTSF